MFTSEKDNEGFWVSAADLMAGLMITFLFIAVIYMNSALKEKEEAIMQKNDIEKLLLELEQKNKVIQEIAESWNILEEKIYQELSLEFKDDLIIWDASLDRETLSLKFNEPEILFNVGRSELKQNFKDILSDFFPRYLNILYKFRSDISEIRIEGHTSSEWSHATSKDNSYFLNMKLSQARTRETLQFCLSQENIDNYKSWAISNITANGLSFSQPVMDNGVEDTNLSRRVEFRVITNSKGKIKEILENSKNAD